MGIGKNGDLPWPPLRNEFRYFQRMTTTSSVEGKQNLVITEIDLQKYKLLREYPGVLSDVQEEKGIKYKFEVYEKND
ncbi:hypothetical protein H8958_016340 [Nasalis larvatus]